MTIALDIDGVILDLVTAFCQVCDKAGYSLEYEDITEYHMGRVLGIDDEEFYRLLDLTYESGLIGPYPGAPKGVSGLRELGHEIWLITSRPKRIEEATVRSLEAAGIGYDRLVFANAREKSDHLAKVALVVEDSLEEARELARNGLSVALMRHPWNTAGEGDLPGVTWVGNWAELVSFITSAHPR